MTKIPKNMMSMSYELERVNIPTTVTEIEAVPLNPVNR